MPAEPRLLSLIALLALGGCKTTWTIEDIDGDDYVWPEDCWEKTTPNGDVKSIDINPGKDEAWYDGVDQDCSGGSDYDADGDGFDSAVELGLDGIEVGAPDTVDCDDTDASIRPDAEELCDEVDNDCDGLIDDEDDSLNDTTLWYTDNDRDSFGAAGTEPVEVLGCTYTDGYAANDEDCDDTDEVVNPAAAEVCDEIDNDCDGDVDLDAIDALSWCLDEDEDGFGDPTAPKASACSLPDGYVAEDACTDCDDASAAIYPSEDVVEVCDEIDNDCDGDVDEVEDELDGDICYVDTDLDGWGADDDPSTIRSCACPEGYAEVLGDCDDSRDDVNPGAEERCDGGVSDENCNDLYDDLDDTLSESEKSSWYLDSDSDGYGAGSAILACGTTSDYVSNDDDCDDSEASRYPGATETCGDGLVNDCLSDETDIARQCLLDATPTAQFDGAAGSDLLGTELRPLGDVDGDGYADAAVAATGSTSSKGSVYVLYGDGTLSGVSTSDLQTTLVRGNANNDALGSSVCMAGDVDGDGYDEFAVGAPMANLNGSDSGGIYVVVTPLSAGVNGINSVDSARLTGVAANDNLGVCAGGADWNDDGTVDLAAGGPGADTGASDAGAIYLLSADTVSSTGVSISSVAYATLSGVDAGEGGGAALAAVGDIDGDGVDDLAVGAPDNDDKFTGGGAIYVARGPITADLSLTAVDYYLYGVAASAAAGSALGSADLDADGLDDVLVGAPGADLAYVLFGDTGFTAGAPLSTASITLSGGSSGEQAGTSVAGAGDLDGDGNEDLLVGAPASDDAGTDAGAVYLLFGPLSAGTLNLGTDADLTWTGDDADDGLGAALDGVGDLDGNGYDDILLGAPSSDASATDAGYAWLVLGGLY